MSYLYNGDCLVAMPKLAPESVDCIVTDPPYLVNFRDRSGRSIANDVNGDWLAPAFAEMFRVLKRDAVCISFYGWNKVDLFFDAWKAAGFRVAGHFVFTKSYASKAGLVKYQHESAYLLAKGRPAAPAAPIADVMPFPYSGNRHHPTEKPVAALRIDVGVVRAIALVERMARRRRHVVALACARHPPAADLDRL